MTDDLSRLRRLAGLTESFEPASENEDDLPEIESVKVTNPIAESYARFMSEGASKDFTDGIPADRREDCEDCGGTGETEFEYSRGSSFKDCTNCEGRGWFEKDDDDKEELDESANDEVLVDIARTMLHVDSFEMKGRDALDFVEVSRGQLMKALHAAYEAGQNNKGGWKDDRPKAARDGSLDDSRNPNVNRGW